MSTAMPPDPAKSPFATLYRTHTCGDLRKEHVGRDVTLAGALDRYVDEGTIELRDGYGKTLVRLSPDLRKGLVEQVPTEKEGDPTPKRAPLESVLRVEGKVAAREKPDAASPTGEVALEAKTVRILSPSKEPLVIDFKNDDLPTKERIRHRYVWLRNRKAQENFRFRTKLLTEVRRHLREERFEEVETPLLANRWTAEAKDCFLAIRDPNRVFALPGNRPVHGSLLMAGGFDRTYEIARRFRRLPAYGPFQQPEYHVLDIAMAFADEEDLVRAEDRLLAHVWKTALGEELKLPIPEVPHDVALVRYGTACPDTRYALEIRDVSSAAPKAKAPEVRGIVAKGGALAALRVAGAAEKLDAARLLAGDAAKDATVTVLRVGPEGATPVRYVALQEEVEGFGKAGTGRWRYEKVVEAEPGDGSFLGEVVRAVEAKPGDAVLLCAAEARAAAFEAAARLRAAAAQALGLIQPGKHALVRVTRLPYFRFDAEGNRWTVTGDPLTRPVEEELEGDPHQVHGLGHHLVIDGINVGGGAIRNHDADLQLKLLEVLGFDSEEVGRRFGPLLRAFRFGVPPHGRAGIGIDRLVALLRGLHRIDDVIPLPKDAEGVDPLARTPAPIATSVIRGYLGL